MGGTDLTTHAMTAKSLLPTGVDAGLTGGVAAVLATPGWPALLAMLLAILCIAAVSDLRARVADNSLSLAIAALAVPYWYATGVEGASAVGLHLAVAVAVFALFLAQYAMNLMGAADVKLITAVSLWFPWPIVVQFIVVMSLVGMVLTFGGYAWHRLRRAEGPFVFPFAVAILSGAAVAVHQQYVYHSTLIHPV